MDSSRKKDSILNSKHAEKISAYRIMDDEFMSKVFDGHKEETELVLKIILKKNDLNVISVKTQAELKNLQGRSIKLDILATDKSNRVYNIEVQKSASGASPLRARYHSSLIDSNSVGKGCSWNDLPETYVIFITETDVLQKNLPIYHVERRIKETEEPFNDKAHIIYVNGQNEDETELGLLMHDFRAENPDEMHYKLLADRVRVYKETEEGVNTMNALVEQYGKEEAEKATKATTSKLLKSLGLTPKQYEKLVKELEQNPNKKIKVV